VLDVVEGQALVLDVVEGQALVLAGGRRRSAAVLVEDQVLALAGVRRVPSRVPTRGATCIDAQTPTLPGGDFRSTPGVAVSDPGFFSIMS
jgi:hypothetical protein